MTNRRQDALLGLLFFGALVGLGAMTILLSDFRFGVPMYDAQVVSEDVGFLRAGDPVLVYGMSSGKVQRIERLTVPVDTQGPDGRPLRCTVAVYLRLELDPAVHLRRDHRIRIEDRGVLGGKLIRIDVGRSPEPLDAVKPLVAVASPSVIQSAGAILDENRADLRETIDNLATMTERAASGQGPLGMLLSDDDLAARIQDLLTNLADLSDQLAAGEGTLGRLFQEEGLADKAEEVLNDIGDLTAGLVNGEGTLGKLFQEDAAYDELLSALTEIEAGVTDAREILADVADGEGTLAKLINDDSLYVDAQALFSDLRETAANITDGDGLVAALINDTEMADDFRQILKQLLGAIEDARETTPVQSLGSFLFGTF
jgi:phospholipid/cholesterol/gamma-HCH transport system substrate-binding protein